MILSKVATTFDNCAGLFASQFFCGAKLILAPFAPPRLSELRKVEAEAHAVATISEIESPDSAILDFKIAMSFSLINLYVTAGIGSCHINSS